MDTAFKVLVIIVSSVLTLFLLVAVVALIKVIQLIRSLKRIVVKAEKLADSAEAVGDFFRSATGTVSVGRLISNIVGHVKRHK